MENKIQVQAPSFDYNTLDPETKLFVQEQANKIRDCLKRSVIGIIETGTALNEVRKRFQDGQWLLWLRSEFQMVQQTANRFMRVADKFAGRFQELPNLSNAFDPSALYVLAPEKVPEVVVEKAFKRANEGEKITHAKAVSIVKDYRAGHPEEGKELSNEDKVKKAYKLAERAKRFIEEAGDIVRTPEGMIPSKELKDILSMTKTSLEAIEKEIKIPGKKRKTKRGGENYPPPEKAIPKSDQKSRVIEH